MAERNGQDLGNYRLERLIGSGGYAEVYLGKHRYLHTQAAIKISHTSLGSAELERFLREARLIASLVHPHIVRILDFGVEAGTAFLVMDYAPHGSLAERYPGGLTLPIKLILSPVQQVADALDYAHAAQRMHLDVKPANLLLGRQHDVWLSDFGIAMAAEDSHQAGESNVSATPAYTAPEQVQGQPIPASDQYSLGVVVYEWITGTLPFVGTPLEMAAQHVLKAPIPLREHIPMLSPELEAVVLRALAKDPQERFANVSAFAQALSEASQAAEEMPFVVRKTSAPFTPETMPSALPRLTPSLEIEEATVGERPAEGDLVEEPAEAAEVERRSGSLPPGVFVPLGSAAQAAGKATTPRGTPTRKRSGKLPLIVACLSILAIAVLVVGGFAFQWGSPHLSPASLPNFAQRQPASTAVGAGPSPAPTSQPSPQPTPPRATPTSPSTTPGPSPTASTDVFALAPISNSQTCAGNGTKLPGMEITLDNTGGQSAVTWQVQITQMDARGTIWASGTPTSGTIAAGATGTLQVSPEKHLCMGFQSTTSFQATITYQTSTGSGTLFFTDVIMSGG